MLSFAEKSKFYGNCQKVPKRPKNDQRPNRKSSDPKTLKTTNLVANDQKWQHCHNRNFKTNEVAQGFKQKLR